MGRCLGAAGTKEAARGPEFRDHKLTGLAGTVAYAKNSAITRSKTMPLGRKKVHRVSWH